MLLSPETERARNRGGQGLCTHIALCVLLVLFIVLSALILIAPNTERADGGATLLFVMGVIVVCLGGVKLLVVLSRVYKACIDRIYE